MTTAPTDVSATPSGTFAIGGDLDVVRLGYGTMQLTGDGVWGWPADRDNAVAVLRRAVELGVTFFDTADSYGPVVAEALLKEALHPYADDVVIATKAGLTRQGPGQWTPVGVPAYLRQQCEMSLRHLGLERIDLFQLHRIDPDVPEDEQFGVLADLQREGKIRFIGLSEVPVAAIQRARRTLPIVSVQNRYNVTDRASDPVVDYCERERMAFLPWYPLGAGALQDAGTIERVAAKHGATAMQVALAWLLARSPAMLAIPGTSQVAHLEENVAAAAIRLDAQDMLDLARIGTPG